MSLQGRTVASADVPLARVAAVRSVVAVVVVFVVVAAEGGQDGGPVDVGTVGRRRQEGALVGPGRGALSADHAAVGQHLPGLFQCRGARQMAQLVKFSFNFLKFKPATLHQLMMTIQLIWQRCVV
jgi:hypothetical protein